MVPVLRNPEPVSQTDRILFGGLLEHENANDDNTAFAEYIEDINVFGPNIVEDEEITSSNEISVDRNIVFVERSS